MASSGGRTFNKVINEFRKNIAGFEKGHHYA